jgi:peptidyl-prolyl cis-trans isomerase C
MGSIFGFFGPKIRCQHILVKDEALAQKLAVELQQGGNFSDAALKHSHCPSKATGGDLGAFRKGNMVPEFDAAAFALKVGQTSGVVKTKFGYHIIRRTG